MTSSSMVSPKSYRLPVGLAHFAIPALGIAEEVEQLQLKGNKRKKGLKLDEDYIVCHPI